MLGITLQQAGAARDGLNSIAEIMRHTRRELPECGSCFRATQPRFQIGPPLHFLPAAQGRVLGACCQPEQ
jgi:hypothetical protein